MATCQQHDFVATAFPTKIECVLQQPRADAPLAIIGMGNNIFDEGIRPPAARQVGHEDQGTGGD